MKQCRNWAYMGSKHDTPVLSERRQSLPNSPSAQRIHARRTFIHKNNYTSKGQFQTKAKRKKRLDDLLFDPPSSPIANCSFLFCPPLSVSATACTFPSSPHSRNSRSRSSSVSRSSPPSDHFTARHTRSVCIHVRPSNRTFFCGTIPSTPRAGRGCPPAKVMVPLVMLERPARMDSVVDFPALHTWNRD
jgi:hypothetical protein